MRKLGLSLLVCGMVMVPYAALSQESSSPDADEFVCALSGECADEADAGETSGDPNAPRVSATRGFSLANPTPTSTRPAPKATAPRSNNRRQATPRTNRRQQQAARPAAAQPGRADLRVAFGPGSSTLSAEAQARVRALAEALKRPQLAGMRLRIEGHTDSAGGRALNQSLSQKRAQAVADFLVGQGIPASRLEVRGYGYDRPLPGRSAASSDNRRVEAVRIS